MEEKRRIKWIYLLLSVVMVFTLIPFTGLQEAKAATNSMTIDLSQDPYKATYTGAEAEAIYEFIDSLCAHNMVVRTMKVDDSMVKTMDLNLDRDAAGNNDVYMIAYFSGGVANQIVMEKKGSCNIDDNIGWRANDLTLGELFINFKYEPPATITGKDNFKAMLVNDYAEYTGADARALDRFMFYITESDGVKFEEVEYYLQRIVYKIDLDCNNDYDILWTNDYDSAGLIEKITLERLDTWSIQDGITLGIDDVAINALSNMTLENSWGLSYFFKTVTFSEAGFIIGPPAIYIGGADVQLSKTSFTYNGKNQRPEIASIANHTLTEGRDYTVEWPAVSKNAGTYTVKITGAGYYSGETEATYRIDPAKVALPKGKVLVYNGSAQTGVAAGAAYTVSGNKATNAGAYTAKLTLKDAKNNRWADGTSAAKSVKWRISKAANPMRVRGKTAQLAANKLVDKAQVLKTSKAIKFAKKGQGKVTYKVISVKKKNKNFTKYIKYSAKKKGFVVAKGMKKGEYKVKVKIKAAGNKNYKAVTKAATFKVIVN